MHVYIVEYIAVYHIKIYFTSTSRRRGPARLRATARERREPPTPERGPRSCDVQYRRHTITQVCVKKSKGPMSEARISTHSDTRAGNARRWPRRAVSLLYCTRRHPALEATAASRFVTRSKVSTRNVAGPPHPPGAPRTAAPCTVLGAPGGCAHYWLRVVATCPARRYALL